MLGILIAGFTFDLGTKHWAFSNLTASPIHLDRERLLADPDHQPIPMHEPHALLPGDLLTVRLVINRGAVFGIADNQRLFFICFTIAALSFALFLFARRTIAGHHHVHLAIGLVFAGGLGNLYDRVRFGVVRDFLQFLPDVRLPFGWTWPGNNPELMPWVFNPADLFLLIGMVILFVYINRRRRSENANTARLDVGLDESV